MKTTTKTNKTIFDTTALRARILEDHTLDGFAAIIGMKPSTLASRLDNHTEFHMHEMSRIRAALNLSQDEMTRYFFTPENDVLIADMFMEMTVHQKNLLLEIMDLTIGRPDRQQYARNYTGRMKDLPELLAQI